MLNWKCRCSYLICIEKMSLYFKAIFDINCKSFLPWTCSLWRTPRPPFWTRRAPPRRTRGRRWGRYGRSHWSHLRSPAQSSSLEVFFEKSVQKKFLLKVEKSSISTFSKKFLSENDFQTWIACSMGLRPNIFMAANRS